MASDRRPRRLVLVGPGEGGDTLLAGRVEVAGTVGARFMGLMFRPALPAGHGIAITPCSSIHMFFMRFPIDVAFVDRDGVVRRAYHGIRPWRMSRVVRGARTAYELPAGTLAGAGVERGSRLRLEAAADPDGRAAR